MEHVIDACPRSPCSLLIRTTLPFHTIPEPLVLISQSLEPSLLLSISQRMMIPGANKLENNPKPMQQLNVKYLIIPLSSFCSRISIPVYAFTSLPYIQADMM